MNSKQIEAGKTYAGKGGRQRLALTVSELDSFVSDRMRNHNRRRMSYRTESGKERSVDLGSFADWCICEVTR